MNANDLAFELYKMGCEIPISELDIGDIIFNKHQGEDSNESDTFFYEKICYRRIAHVAMVYDFDTNGNPIIIESTPNNSDLAILKRGLDFQYSGDRVRAGLLLMNNVMCARLPIAFGYESNVPNQITVLNAPVIS